MPVKREVENFKINSALQIQRKHAAVTHKRTEKEYEVRISLNSSLHNITHSN